MASMLAFSGWAQSPTALNGLLSGAVTVDYLKYENLKAFLDSHEASAECEVVLGWSLGGAVALAAMAAGRLKTRYLVLIATPYQFVVSPTFPQGMSEAIFNEFCKDYAQRTALTLKRFQLLMVQGDTALSHNDAPPAHVQPHLGAWLQELGRFRAASLKMLEKPLHTLIVQGMQDRVVHPGNAHAIHQLLPQAEIVRLEGCAHAPHLHSPQLLAEKIKAFCGI